mmetsp:Transcript_2676/g.7086  ORF Transcript_2676/g.7086 Transcript_2676/m.7086 type:complete len:225 (-) Transcript_2676:95-769(-)
MGLWPGRDGPRMVRAGGLVVQVLVVVAGGRTKGGPARGGRRAAGGVGELEGAAEAAALLQRLREHLVLADVVVGDRAACVLHRLLEVAARDLRHGVLGVLHRRLGARGCDCLLAFNFLLDRLADRQLGRALADLREVRAREALRDARQVDQVDVRGDGRLAQHGLEDVGARALVGQRDVDELVQAPWAEHGRVDDVGAVGGADDEDRLLRAHTCEHDQEYHEGY